MKLIPASLTWRTLLVLVGALVLSQVIALWLLHTFVAQPRAAFGVGQFVSHLKTISAALQTMSPDQQEAFIMRIEMGCAYREIAAFIGRPSAEASRMLVRRAVASLVEKLRERVRR